MLGSAHYRQAADTAASIQFAAVQGRAITGPCRLHVDLFGILEFLPLHSGHEQIDDGVVFTVAHPTAKACNCAVASSHTSLSTVSTFYANIGVPKYVQVSSAQVPSWTLGYRTSKSKCRPH